MRIVYFGSGEFAVPSLRWLHNSPHPALLVAVSYTHLTLPTIYSV